MATRKPWESLSQSYRDRLTKKGITPEMHSRGASIKAARGHEHTPERPTQSRGKKEYSDYNSRRRSLVSQVNRRKQQLWGDTHDYHPARSRRITDSGSDSEHAPSLSKLQWAANATDDELERMAASKDEEYSFLWYH